MSSRDLFLFNSTHPEVFKGGAIQGQIVNFSFLPDLNSNLVSHVDKSQIKLTYVNKNSHVTFHPIYDHS